MLAHVCIWVHRFKVVSESHLSCEVMVGWSHILGLLLDRCVLLVTTRNGDVAIGNWKVIVGFPVPTAGWKVAVHACEPHCGTGDEVLWRVFEGVARQQGGQLGVMSAGLKSCLLSVPGPDKNRQAGLGQPAWSCHHGHLLTAIITSTPTSHRYSIQTQLGAPHVPLQPAITNTPAALTRLPFFPLNESLINIVGSGDAGLYGGCWTRLGLCSGNQLKYRFISCPLCLGTSSRDCILLSVYLQFPATCNMSWRHTVTSGEGQTGCSHDHMVSEPWSELVLAGINISLCSSTPVSPPLSPLSSQQGPLIYRNTPKDSTRQTPRVVHL